MWHFLGTNFRMVFETDESEALTVLGEDEPDNYDYESDEHTEVIERPKAAKDARIRAEAIAV